MWRIVSVLLCFGVLTAAGAIAQSGRWSADGYRLLDRKTGLTWQRCAAGQHWTGRQCAGTPGRHTWDHAAALSGGGWRLPTPEELTTLVDPDRKRRGLVPTLDPAAFPELPAHQNLDTWTAFRRECPVNQEAGCGIVVTFASPAGADLWDRPVNIPMMVRLVRGAISPAGLPPNQRAAAEPPRRTSNGRFEISANIARDLRTGLIWRRCEEGRQMTLDLGCGGVVHRFPMAEALRMGGDGWRLPTLEELKTLIDPVRMRQGRSPYIDQEAFPAGPVDIDQYWTGTRYTSAGDQMWCVNFHLGVPGHC